MIKAPIVIHLNFQRREDFFLDSTSLFWRARSRILDVIIFLFEAIEIKDRLRFFIASHRKLLSIPKNERI
jgi:hypothetical protein